MSDFVPQKQTAPTAPHVKAAPAPRKWKLPMVVSQKKVAQMELPPLGEELSPGAAMMVMKKEPSPHQAPTPLKVLASAMVKDARESPDSEAMPLGRRAMDPLR